MMTGFRQRAALVLAYLLIVAALSGAVWRYGYGQALDQLAARGGADLALAGDRLVSQLQRYRDLSVLMADHPQVVAVLRGQSAPDTDRLLQKVADQSGTLDVMIVSRTGQVIASAQGDQVRNLNGQAYVERALGGALGWGHGPGQPLTARAFYHAAPVFGDGGAVLGAVVVFTDLNGIDYNWRATNPAAFFTDAAGIVYIANRSELLFWKRPATGAGLVPPLGDAPLIAARQFGPHEIWELDRGPYLPRRAMHLTRALPVIGLTGEVLVDVSPARQLAMTQAAAVAALCLAFGSLLFLAAERRRTLALANATLEARVAERTAALRETNTQLRREAAEREEAQAALRRAQADLVQAGKLSALGQMSAGISHELNQPLMAIRSFAENAAAFIERDKPERASENLLRISDMARRMGRIIRNLRAFARQESGPRAPVELGAVIRASLDLTQSHAGDQGVTVQCDAPDAPVWVQGGEVRLGQVFVNLITNAVDAMAISDEKLLSISVVQGPPLTVSFRDTGPGIEMPDKVFDPFYTTKPAGSTGGTGLGLSISYGIVQSFGGQIRGSNCAGGGALFTVTLEPAPEQTMAAQ